MPVCRPRVPALRALLAAIAVVAFAAAGAQLARGADGGQPTVNGTVTIVLPNGKGERTLRLADLAAKHDVHNALYTLRAADGATSPLPVASGISLAALLRAAGLDTVTFDYVSVPRPDGSVTLLLADQIGKGQGGPAVVWSDEEGVHFLRPSLTDDDPNATDHVVQAGGELRIELKLGDPLIARISASKLRARPGEAITFTAALVAGTLAPGMTFRWYFDGSDYVYGASATHRFRRPGTYQVLLDIVRGEESIGVPEIIEVVITRPRSERGRARRSGESRRDGVDDGADRGGGAGGATGTGAGAGAGGGTGGGAGGITPPSTQIATPPPPERPVPKPKPRRKPAPAEPQGELVSGTLLAAADGLPPSGGNAATSQQQRDVTAPADPLEIPVGVWIVIGLAAILALGWTLESRHTLPFWQP